MSSMDNPYQAPQTLSPPFKAELADVGGVWRKDRLLV
jgi:hypothetical protein